MKRKKIWPMQRNINFGGNLLKQMAENIYWWKLNLAEKHKMAYDKSFSIKKMI